MSINDTLSVRVAEEIRVLLVRRRTSARQLAMKVGLSQSAMSARLTGATPIDLNELDAIARALEVDIADLLPQPSPERPGGGLRRISSPLAMRTTTSHLIGHPEPTHPAPSHPPTTTPTRTTPPAPDTPTGRSAERDIADTRRPVRTCAGVTR